MLNGGLWMFISYKAISALQKDKKSNYSEYLVLFAFSMWI